MDATQLQALLVSLTAVIAGVVGVIGRWATATGRALRKTRARNSLLEQQVYASWRALDRAGADRPSLPDGLAYLLQTEGSDDD